MMTQIKGKLIFTLICSLGLITSAPALASIQIAGIGLGLNVGAIHYHDGYRGGYGPGPGRYYDRGGYYYGGGPNVIINVPVERYYARECDNVEVCDPYGRCWLEQYCD